MQYFCISCELLSFFCIFSTQNDCKFFLNRVEWFLATQKCHRNFCFSIPVPSAEFFPIKPYSLFIAADNHKTKLLHNIATRIDGTVTLNFLPKLVGKTMNVWQCILNEDATRFLFLRMLGM